MLILFSQYNLNRFHVKVAINKGLPAAKNDAITL